MWLAGRNWRVSGVDLSDVAIGKLNQSALELNVRLDLSVGDVSEHPLSEAQFDLIVLFYHGDRSLLSKLVGALNPRGLLICKLSLDWNTDARLMVAASDPLNRNELPSIVPELCLLHHQERPVRDRGVVEFAGRKNA